MKINVRSASPAPWSPDFERAGAGELAVAVGVGILLVWLWLPFARIGVDLHHDGIMLKPALDVLSGQVLFRDSFNQYGALTVYLHALGLWLHPALFTLKAMSVVAVVTSLLIFYAAWRELMPRSLAVAGALMFTLFISFVDIAWPLLPWSSDFAMLFQAVALYALLQVIRGDHATRWAAVSGMACAACFWCRQPVGMLISVAAGVILVASWWAGWRLPGREHRRVFAAVVLGFVGVNVVMFGGLWVSGALPDWWEQNILWPRRWASAGWYAGSVIQRYCEARISPFPVLGLAAGFGLILGPWLWARWRRKAWPVAGLAVYFGALAAAALFARGFWLDWADLARAGWEAMLLVLVAGLSLWSFVIAIRSRLKGGSTPGTGFFLLAALTGVSLASLAQIYPIPCPRHVFWALAPTFGLAGYAIWRWSGVKAWAVAVAIGVLLVPAIEYQAKLRHNTLHQPLQDIVTPSLLAGMRVKSEEAEFLRDFGDFFARVRAVRPDTSVTLFGIDAFMLCLAPNLDNPGPYYVTWGGLIPKGEIKLRWMRILATRPLIVEHHYGQSDLRKFVANENYVRVWSREAQDLQIFAPREWADLVATPAANPEH